MRATPRPAVRRGLAAPGALVVLLAVVTLGCVRPELVHWDEERQEGIVLQGRPYANHRDNVRAQDVMDDACGDDRVVHGQRGQGHVRLPDRKPMPSGRRPGYFWSFRCEPGWLEVKSRTPQPSEPPKPPPAPPPRELSLELDAPGIDEKTVNTAVVEVRGAASGRGLQGHDLVIVLDLSDSTLRHSGFDVDGDGPEGSTDPQLARQILERTRDRYLADQVRETDFDDSVLMAVLKAAEVLVDRIDLEDSRIGLVAFSNSAVVVVPLTDQRDRLMEGIATLRTEFEGFLTGTNFADALYMGNVSLGAPMERERSLVLLSDGKPTVPANPTVAAEKARLQADALAQFGTRVYAFALGPDAVEALPVFQDVAARTGGRIEKLEAAGDAIVALRDIDLADLDSIQVRNRTTGKPARAMRVFPTGAFDGFVDLAPGANTIQIEARLTDGKTATLERDVTFTPDAESDAEMAALKDLLQRRALELALWEEMKRTRRMQKRVLQLEIEEP